MFQEYNYLFKIVIIGDSGVGKTNLVSQFVDERFIHDEKPTVGVEFASKIVHLKDNIIRCQIWDTAGQERFRVVTRAYYNGAVGALVVFDLTNSHTFQSVNRWVEEIHQNTNKDTVIMLIGNKDDLKQREVRVEKVEEMMQKSQSIIIYLETSAKTGHNVNEAFQYLIEQIYQRKINELEAQKKIIETTAGSKTDNHNDKTSKNIVLSSQAYKLQMGRDVEKRKKKKCC